MSTVTRVQIDKLNSTNYSTWRNLMKAVLTKEKAWKVVSGDETFTGAGGDPAKEAEFNDKNDQAYSSILLNIEPSLTYHIEDCTNAKEAWDILKAQFSDTSASQRINVLREIVDAKYDASKGMLEHLSKMKSAYEQYKKLGSEIKEDEFVMLIMLRLPDSYQSIVSSICVTGDANLKFEHVKSCLLNHENSLNAKGQHSKKGDSSAFVAKRVGSNECFKCGKEGHYARDCWQRGDRNSQNSNRGRGTTNTNAGSYRSRGFNRGGPRGRGGGNNRGRGSSNNCSIDADEAAFNAMRAKETFCGYSCQDSSWIIDSGASHHMTYSRNVITDFEQFDPPVNITLADQSRVLCYGKGRVVLRVTVNNALRNFPVSDVYYVPKLGKNLLSVPTAMKKGWTCILKGEGAKLIDVHGRLRGVGRISSGNLIHLVVAEDGSANAVSSANLGSNAQLWHHRFGHLGADSLKTLSREKMVKGMDLGKLDVSEIRDCESCAKGKQTRKPFPKESQRRASKLLGLIHSDVCGPMHVESVGGRRYYVAFIDDKSRMVCVYFMKHKSEVLSKFKEFVAMAENFCGERVKVLRSDNGGEYTSNDFDEFCREKGIQREFTVADCPEQNGSSERMNRTLMDPARAMLFDSNLPPFLWAEAVSTAAYLRNRSPTAALKGMTPYECWFGRKPNVSMLRTFGCKVTVHIPKDKRRKLDSKARTGIFVGYGIGQKGFRVYFPRERSVKVERNLKFMENKMGNEDPIETGSFDKEIFKNFLDLVIVPETPKEAEHEEAENDESFETVEGDHDESDETMANEESDEETYEQRFQRQTREIGPSRARKAPDRFEARKVVLSAHHAQLHLSAYIMQMDVNEPKTLKQAAESGYRHQWKAATDSEFESLIANETWDLVDLPKDKNVVGCKWVFKVKPKADGSIDKFKARLVAQGYSQEYGLDYNEVFAPVVRGESIRTVLSIANSLDMELHQMDVKTAFLNGKIDAEIYMEQPQGYVDVVQPKAVCKLKKGLYGLKQAARCWNIEMDKYLKRIGYKQSDSDSCVYTKKKSEKLMIIALYVDDILIASNDKNWLLDEKKALKKGFAMVDQGEACYILGMRIQRDRKKRELCLDQKRYVESVLNRFGMTDCAPTKTPLDQNQRFVDPSEKEKTVDRKKYQAVIGSLIYAATGTRPDISAAVGILSSFCAEPKHEHWTAVIRILRYLKGTANFGIKFSGSGNIVLHGYSDADWAGDQITRKSTSGNVLFIGGGPVSWKSKRQPVIARSSSEAEYYALDLAARESVFLRKVLNDLGFSQTAPTVIYCDNTSAISWTKNAVDHPRTRHIDIMYKWIKAQVDAGIVETPYISTSEMVADIMTKGLCELKFVQHRNSLGVVKMPNC